MDSLGAILCKNSLMRPQQEGDSWLRRRSRTLAWAIMVIIGIYDRSMYVVRMAVSLRQEI